MKTTATIIALAIAALPLRGISADGASKTPSAGTTVEQQDSIVSFDFVADANSALTQAEDDAAFLALCQAYTENKGYSFQGGGIEEFKKWVYSKLEYPSQILNDRIQGTVMTSFVIECDGQITNIEVTSSPHELLSKEVIRVLQLSPRWEPIKLHGRKIRTKMSLPVTFRF